MLKLLGNCYLDRGNRGFCGANLMVENSPHHRVADRFSKYARLQSLCIDYNAGFYAGILAFEQDQTAKSLATFR